MGRAILWKVGSCLKREIGIGAKLSQTQQRSAVGGHTSTVRRDRRESNRSLFFVQRRFQTLTYRKAPCHGLLSSLRSVPARFVYGFQKLIQCTCHGVRLEIRAGEQAPAGSRHGEA